MSFFLLWENWEKSHRFVCRFFLLWDKQTYDFFPSFRTAKKRHTNLWLFSPFSDGKKTTYKPMTFFPVFPRQKKRHTNVWLFYQFSNDIQTYDFFTTFRTTYKRMTFLPLVYNDMQTYDFFTTFRTTYKRMTFLPLFERHTNVWLF